MRAAPVLAAGTARRRRSPAGSAARRVPSSREQFGQRARVHHRARQDVRAGLRAFFEHDHRHFLACGRGQLLQPDRRGQAGGPARRRRPRRIPWLRAGRTGRGFPAVSWRSWGMSTNCDDSTSACYREAHMRRRAHRARAICGRRIATGEHGMSYSIDLSGRVALVTGASSGLGAQFARTLAAAGAGVVLAGAAHRAAEDAARRDRGRRRRRPCGRHWT